MDTIKASVSIFFIWV